MRDQDLTRLIAPTSADCATRRRRCPEEGQLAAFVEGGLTEEDRRAVMLHLADCAFCRGQVGFLIRAQRFEAPQPVPSRLLAAARGEHSWWAGRFRPAALVAATAGVTLAIVLVASREREGLLRAVTRVPGSAATSPSGLTAERPVRTSHGVAGAPTIVSPAEGQSVLRGAFELQWEAAPGALFYSAQLVNAKGDVVWEGRVEGTRLTVPAVTPLVPGQTYFAWILAHLRSGATVRSPAVGFQLATE